MKWTDEFKVGTLVVGTTLLALVFAWVLGVENPFKRDLTFYVTYHFAGGVDVGSPVRVSGIKVGKVEKIEFFARPDQSAVAVKEPGSAESEDTQAWIPVRLKVSVSKDAAVGIRKDSRFYINLAGVIGERYIEITPGSLSAAQVSPGDTLAGVDPPRIDQLISQSFNLAGKITDLIEKNKGDITKSIELLYKLSENLNRTLHWVDKSKMFQTDLSKLINNLIDITTSMKKVTDKVQSPEGEKTLHLMYELLWRLEPMDSKTIRTFLQKEGVKVQLF